MIKHLVMWKLKDEVKPTKEALDAIITEQTKRFRAMQARIPEIEALTVYPAIKQGKDFYDFVVVMDFADRDALERMQRSDAHHDPSDREFVARIRECKAVVDYEL